MKKKLFLVMLIACSAQTLLAQGAFTAWSENFDNGIPADWTVEDNSNNPNLSLTWESLTTSTGETVARIQHFDPNTFEINSANDWLISGPIDLTQFGSDLQVKIDFSYLIDAPAGASDATNEVVGVYAYTTPDTLDLADNGYVGTFAVDQNSTPFQQSSLQLPTNFAGQTVYIAIRALGTATFNAYKPYPGAKRSIGFAINSLEITATEVLSVEDNEKSNLSFYPNPVREHLYFQSSGVKNAEVSIYNMLGKMVMQTSYTQNGIDVSSLNSGMYLIKLNIDGKIQTLKIIKQ